MAWFVPSRSLPLQSNGSSVLWSRLLRYSGAGVGCARTAGDLHLTANVRQSHALQPCLRQSGNGLCVNVLLELSKGDPVPSTSTFQELGNQGRKKTKEGKKERKIRHEQTLAQGSMSCQGPQVTVGSTLGPSPESILQSEDQEINQETKPGNKSSSRTVVENPQGHASLLETGGSRSPSSQPRIPKCRSSLGPSSLAN